MAAFGANGLNSGNDNQGPQSNSLQFGPYVLTTGPTYGLVKERTKYSSSTPKGSPIKGDPNGCENKDEFQEKLRANKFSLEIAAKTQLIPDELYSSTLEPQKVPSSTPTCARRLFM